jgi:dihydroxyacetone kinase-like protein
MKKVINEPKNVVPEMLKGLVYAFPSLENVPLDGSEGSGVISRKVKKTNKVALISGGGSGHEPSHAGFVGTGMLDAAVCGPVFTSPPVDAVAAAIANVKTDAGVLLIIKNYTGDVMNFEMAMETPEAEGVKVDKVVVDDDVAVQNSTWTAGRRGIAGTVLIHKIAGAKAEEGASLAEVKATAEKVIANVRTMGVALTPSIVPEAGKPNFTLANDEIEIGLGIHGEPGVKRGKLMTADEITDVLLDKVLNDNVDYKGSDVLVLVNGLGATPLMELFIVNNRVNEVLKEKGVNIYKTYVGNYMTSIEMAGFSVSLLKLDDELKKLANAPANTPALTQY